MTDLFVEKALTYLNKKSRSYTRQGSALITIAVCIIGLAAYIAGTSSKDHLPVEVMIAPQAKGWILLLFVFMKSFTFYGLMILGSVILCRMAKSLFDQAERINDRRHALRQGRLIVHLNNGVLGTKELIEAFSWNVSQDNAFSHFNPEAKAPWGNVVAEILKTTRETAKSVASMPEEVAKASRRS